MIFVGSCRVLARCQPPAILRAVVPIRIYPVYAEVVGIAISKRPLFECQIIVPLFADLYALASIKTVGVMRLSVASLPHTAPDAIEPGVIPVTFAMLRMTFPKLSDYFSAKTAA